MHCWMGERSGLLDIKQAQPLADCLTSLHRETCEILAQSETISDLSFDLARIQEGAGLGS